MDNKNLLRQREIVERVFKNYNISNGYDEMIFWKRENMLQNNSVRVFTEEIKYMQNKYSISNSVILYLYLLIPYLSKGNNLLINNDGTPMNQTDMSKTLVVDRKTISRNINALEENKCLIKIQ